MEYVVISVLSIIFMVYLVDKVANNLFKLHLRMKSLVLCAGCALFISIVIPRVIIGHVNIADTIVAAVFIAVIFAYYMAYYEDKHNNRMNETQKHEVTDTIIPPPLQEDPVIILLPPQALSAEQECIEDAAIAIVDDSTVEIASLHSETLDDLLEYGFEQKEEPKDPVIIPLPPQTVSIEQERIEDAAIAIVDDNTVEIASPQSEALDDLLEDEPEQEEQKEPVIIPLPPQTVSVEHERVEDAAIAIVDDNAVEITSPQSEALDDLLEYGFEQKNKQNDSQALQAFKTALKLYFESAVAPFLVVEIGNILKKQGAYEEAIQIFNYGRNLPELSKRPLLDKEFIATIAYLQIIRNVLLRENLGFIPFKDISSDMQKQIEFDFCEWRKLN